MIYAAAIIGSVLIGLWVRSRFRFAIRRRELLSHPAKADFEKLELGEFPQELHEQLHLATEGLDALSFVPLGNCRRCGLRGEQFLYSIWIRGHDLAEILAISAPCIIPYITLVIGREFSDGTSIAIVNSSIIIPDEAEHRAINLPGVWDVPKLCRAASRIIEHEAGDRQPWVPTDVMEYKSRDFHRYFEAISKNPYYRLNRERMRFEPTLPYALGLASPPRISLQAYLPRLNYFLENLGLESLQSMRQSPMGFPVIELPASPPAPIPDTPPSSSV